MSSKVLCVSDHFQFFCNLNAKESSESGNKSDLDQIRLKIIVPMFNHFDMTPNIGDHSMSNDLLHVFLFKHVVACKFDARKVYSPMLGLFNDEYCQSFDMNKSFTYMCNLSCNIFMPSTYDNILALYFMIYESYSCIHVSYVQKSREVKMDDI